MKNPLNIVANLPCGTGGLNSNFNTYRVPISSLVKATNIRFDNLAFTKAPGIGAVGPAISGADVCLGARTFDANAATSVGISAWDNGNIYKQSGTDFGSVNLGAFGATSEPVVMVPFSDLAESGSPIANKLMFFSKGTTPKQLIGTAATFTTLTNVSPDWAGADAPLGGCLHDFRMVAFGVDSYPHNIYFSTLTDLSDFTSSGAKAMSVYPGDGGKIVAGLSYLDTVLAIFKSNGIYLVDTEDLTLPVNPAFRVTNVLGAAGPNALTKVNGDIWFISDQGRIHSLTQLRGDIDPKQSDLTHQLQLTEYTRREIDLSRIKWATLYFDHLRQEVIYSFTRKGSNTVNDTCIVIRLPSEQNPPMVSLDSRGTFYNALWSRTDVEGRNEVLCAGDGGQVLTFNDINKNVLGDPYTGTFSHPPTDFSFLDARFAMVEKHFKFLQLQILPTGSSSTLSIDIFVDGTYRRTENVSLASDTAAVYGTSEYGTAVFAGSDYTPRQIEIDITGTKIQFVCYNSAEGQDFAVVDMNVVFTLADSVYEDR
jgi:hypothetical protein